MTSTPGGSEHNHTAPIVNVPASYRDSQTGAVYVHKDLSLAISPYQFEDHIEPPQADERFGDVESWVAYVLRFASGAPHAPLLTYSTRELHAVLDYHTDTTEGGRCQWHASMPFVKSKSWLDWAGFCNDQARTHQQMIEFLEDHQPDIFSPKEAELLNLLRGLTVLSKSAVDIKRNVDGTQSITAVGDQKITAHGQAELALPATIVIEIQVLKGHRSKATGSDIKSQMEVRLRSSVSKEGVPSFRFSLPVMEKAFEMVVNEQIKEAENLLGADLRLLRAHEGN